MAAAEPYDYLPGTASVDYDAGLGLVPQEVMTELVGFPGQKRHVSDGSTYLTTTRNTTPRFRFVVLFNGLSEADAGTLLDFYADTSKAMGMARSFNFAHPDGHSYIVKFEARELNRLIYPSHWGKPAFNLLVIDQAT